MDSLFSGLATLSLNPAGRLERMRQERTMIAMREKMDPRFATSRAAARKVSRARRIRKDTLKRPRSMVNF